jgi:uncharacterized protein YbaR (Trm112 family)
MAQYIKKAALLAEIERRRDGITKGIFSIPLTGSDRASATFEYEILGKIKDFINTLEVKEVDLNEEIELVKGDYEQVDVAWNNDFDYIAKHFFELGLRSTITEEDCKLIWNIGDEIPCMTEEEFFKELLRRYKAHKGEEV